jgi:hypothetical protein
MLNIVFDYLSLFNMIANALKTEILTNLSRLALEELLATHPLPHLGNSPIHAIHPNNHLARILGAYITMDGLHQKTIDHALETVKRQIKLIRMKLTPGPIAVYLINTVIIPCLLYRLQISCVSVKTISKINSLFRQLVKQKFSFMRNLHSNLLYDINFGMKLHDVAIKRSQQLITNTNVHIRDCNVTGILFRFCTLNISSQFPHIHESILVCPIKTVSRKGRYL